MQKPKYSHRLLALLVAAFMAVCCLPMAVFAQDPEEVKNVTVNFTFWYDEENLGGGDLILTEGVHNYSEVAESVIMPEGYVLETVGDFYAADDESYRVNVVPEVKNVTVNFTFWYGEENLGGGDLILTEGVHNYNEVAESIIMPEGYVLETVGDFYAADDKSYRVNVVPEVKNVTVNFTFWYGEENLGGGDLILTEGVHNYNEVAESIIMPEGYVLETVGDFYATDGKSYRVSVVPAVKDVVVNFTFWYGEENLGGGDLILTEGVHNYNEVAESIIMPEGYVLETVGDFYAADGKSYRVSVKPLIAEIIMNIRFMDGETFVAGGDYFVPEGVQNYTVLNQYMPEGYEMDVAGDFMAKAGAQLTVPVHKTETSQPVAPSVPEQPSNNNTTTTVSSNDKNDNDVVKSETPADNSSKIIPQTGLTIEQPMVLAVMMASAFIAAAAYLFVIRKKLN